MRVLKVIHGFPPDYMAGSEVYSYHLVKELNKVGIDVSVFSRVENQFHENYKIYREKYENIPILRVNKPKRDYLYFDKFYDKNMNKIFRKELETKNPEIVHFGHLSHLSIDLIAIAKELNLPVVYTIHDFWLFCVKGQMINELGEICQNPSIENCQKCSPYNPKKEEVEKAFSDLKNIIDLVDIFISPSHTLRNFFISQGVPKEKIIYSKYGFDKSKIEFKRKSFKIGDKIKFGFMGRVIPTKGIKVLTEVFSDLENETLNIYGNIGAEKRFLESKNIIFKGGYKNEDISEVLKDIDVLIVPSTWLENAPLVIQEAFLSGIPVITSNIGGMAELVQNRKNGFLFEVGNSKDLKRVIAEISKNPKVLNSLEIDRNSVVDISDEVQNILEIYKGLLNAR
jgi:glycosyltransferase involved in cell wall biosynthesis